MSTLRALRPLSGSVSLLVHLLGCHQRGHTKDFAEHDVPLSCCVRVKIEIRDEAYRVTCRMPNGGNLCSVGCPRSCDIVPARSYWVMATLWRLRIEVFPACYPEVRHPHASKGSAHASKGKLHRHNLTVGREGSRPRHTSSAQPAIARLGRSVSVIAVPMIASHADRVYRWLSDCMDIGPAPPK